MMRCYGRLWAENSVALIPTLCKSERIEKAYRECYSLDDVGSKLLIYIEKI